MFRSRQFDLEEQLREANQCSTHWYSRSEQLQNNLLVTSRRQKFLVAALKAAPNVDLNVESRLIMQDTYSVWREVWGRDGRLREVKLWIRGGGDGQLIREESDDDTDEDEEDKAGPQLPVPVAPGRPAPPELPQGWYAEWVPDEDHPAESAYYYWNEHNDFTTWELSEVVPQDL